MMYLGRNGWPLKAPDESGKAAGLSHALLLGQSLAEPAAGGPAPVEEWRPIMEITSFFAGGSDDVDYPELRRWLGGARSGRSAVARRVFLREVQAAGLVPLAVHALRRFVAEQTLVLCERRAGP